MVQTVRPLVDMVQTLRPWVDVVQTVWPLVDVDKVALPSVVAWEELSSDPVRRYKQQLIGECDVRRLSS